LYIYIYIYYVYIVISFKPIKEFAPFGFTAQVRRTPDTWGHLGTPGKPGKQGVSPEFAVEKSLLVN